MDKTWEIEWGKLLLCAVSLIGSFVLIVLAVTVLHENDSRITPIIAFATGNIGLVIGYAAGNGRLAKRGGLPEPMLQRSQPQPPEPSNYTPQ